MLTLAEPLGSDSDLGGKVPCVSGSDLAAAQSNNAIRVALESFAWLWILNVMLGTFHSFAACLCVGLSLKKYEIDLQEHRGRRLRKMIASTNIGMIITTAVLNASVVKKQRHESNGNFGGGFWAILVAIALGLPVSAHPQTRQRKNGPHTGLHRAASFYFTLNGLVSDGTSTGSVGFKGPTSE